MVAPAVEGIDLFNIAGRSISGWIPSLKTGAPTPVRQPSQEEHYPENRRQGQHPLPNHDLIVIGASAGGVEALLTLTSRLPAFLPAAVLIVQHLSARWPSRLPQLLSRAGPLPARWAVPNMRIEPGTITVAPPDHHLQVQGTHLQVGRGPREQGVRPCINVLFRSAAASFGPRVVGVILSGMLADGAEGLLTIKQHGGVAIVQDPRDATFPQMPQSALAHLESNCVLEVASMAPLLVQLTASRPRETSFREAVRDSSQGHAPSR